MSDTDKPYRPGCSPPVVFLEKLVKLDPPVKQEVLDRVAKMPIFPVRVEEPLLLKILRKIFRRMAGRRRS